MSEWTLPFGAHLTAGGAGFRIWAPAAQLVEVELEPAAGTGSEATPRRFALTSGEDGVHSGLVAGVRAGDRYRYRLDGEGLFPDPYSRYQPEGPHGPSQLVDPTSFAWTDDAWPGLTMDGLVIYELHVGTMTEAGTYDGLRRELRSLKELGVTAIELMPLADAPGRWNWGYDGVNLYAPNHNYGDPEALRRLVNEAHRIGLGVILDVVYNHFGPDGNYLRAFSPDYFTARHQTPWGDGINYDGGSSRMVRDLAINNACYWLREFHIDGLRFDAIDTIVDDSDQHLLAELTTRAREVALKPVVLIAEQAVNDVEIVTPAAAGGLGFDGAWADDFHHIVRVAVTGAREGYYADYYGSLDELSVALREGFLFQGQAGPGSGKARGTTVTDQPASAFVFCIENHDQVGNRAFGERLGHLIPADLYAALSALLLFAPETPLLFMGQERMTSAPFQFFTDHNAELGELIKAGRREEFKGFQAFADPEARERIPNPQAPTTFRRSRVVRDDGAAHRGIHRLYRDLLRLRRDDPVLRVQARDQLATTEIGPQAIRVTRWAESDERQLLLNLRQEPVIVPVAPDAAAATLLLSTSWRRYGGDGHDPRQRLRGRTAGYELAPRSAIVLAARREPGGN